MTTGIELSQAVVALQQVAVDRRAAEVQELLQRANAEMAPTKYASSRWIARSGLTVTGAEVVAHLDDVLRLLDQKGWVKGTEGADSPLKSVNDSSSITQCVRAALQWLREEYLPQTSNFTLWQAVHATDDSDVAQVTLHVLEAVVTAHTGNTCRDIDAWAGRKTRTFEHVRELIHVARAFAEIYGPTAS